jgi:hypothetical protein
MGPHNWQALVNVVMNLQVPYKAGNSLTGWLVSQGFSSMELVSYK